MEEEEGGEKEEDWVDRTGGRMLKRMRFGRGNIFSEKEGPY